MMPLAFVLDFGTLLYLIKEQLYYVLQSMRQLLETLFYGLKKLQPLLAVDSS